MSGADLQYFSADQSTRLLVEIKDNSEAWVDLNSLAPAGYPDYYAGLMVRPTVTIAADQSDGIYSATIGTIVMDNAPWCGSKAGFWDQPFPVRITRNGVTSQFGSWSNRWLRLTLRSFLPDGSYSDFTLPPFIIDGAPETRSNTATLKLASLFRLFQKRSAESLKVGTDWAAGWPIKSLIKMITNRTNKNILFAAGSDAGTIDLGTADVQRASSWGSAPGILTTGEQAARKWIPRCMCKDRLRDDKIWVGFACPGTHTYEDAAIASFDLLTGQWTVVWESTSIGGYPISICMEPTADLFWVFIVADKAPTDYSFYTCKLIRVGTDGNVNTIATSIPYWPGRETLRKGVELDEDVDYLYRTGAIKSGGEGHIYYGESIVMPFTHVLDCLGRDIDGTPAKLQERVQANGYIQGGDAEVDYITDMTKNLPFVMDGSAAAYAKMATTSTSRAGGFRYFMGTAMHQPYRLMRGTSVFWFSVCLPVNTKNFSLYRFSEFNPTTIVVHPMVNVLGHTGDQLWSAQVTAWAAAPNCTTADTTDKVLLSFIEWDDTAGGSVQWSKTVIVCAAFASSGGDATSTSTLTVGAAGVLDDPADGTRDMARVCVSLWTPPAGSLTAQQVDTLQWSVAVLFNRANLQRPCYGIGIIKCSSGITLTAGQMFGSAGYTGPVSSMPFSGFARCYDDSASFYFTDQATGQAWKCSAVTTTPVWTLLNKGMQIHSSEFSHSSLNAQTCSISATEGAMETVLWGLAPGPSADITGGYPLRDSLPSSARHKPGIYPVVQLSRKIADAIEVADFSGMKAFDAVTMLRQCAWDYRLYFTVDGSKNVLLNVAKTTTGGDVCSLVPLDYSPIPDLLASPPKVGFGPGWSRKLLPVKNAVDVVPYGPTGAGEFTTSVVKAAGSTFDTDYLVSCTTERPLRVAITCVSGGDVTAPAAASASAQKPILWTWERMRETAHCWLASPCIASAEYVWVSGVSTKGGLVYAGNSEIVVGDWITVGGGDKKRITSIPTIAAGSAKVSVGPPGNIGVAASAYSEVTIEPHESRASGTSDDGSVVLASAYTLAPTPGATMSVASTSNIAVGMVLSCRGYSWEITKISGTTLTVSTLFAPTTPADSSLALGTKLSSHVYTKATGKLYAVGATGVQFGIAAPGDDIPGRTVSPGDGVVITAAGMRLDKLNGCTIRSLNQESIGDESAGTGYGRCDVSISDNRFVDALRAEMLADRILVDAYPRTEVSGVTIPAIWPNLTIGSNVMVSDPRITPPVSGVETDAEFVVSGIRYNLDALTSELTIRSVAPANTTGKVRAVTPSAGSAMPAGRQGEE